MRDRSIIDTIRARLADPRDVARRLGCLDHAKPLGRGGLLILCPWHSENTPSCAVAQKDGALVLYCHGACQRGGDVFDFIAGRSGLTLPRDFPDVVRRGADLAGIPIDPRAPLPPLPSRPPPPPPRSYPPVAEVLSLWKACRPVMDDAGAASWCASRGFDGYAIEDRDLARALPAAAVVPRWATYQGRPWTETGHRLLIPVFDAAGAMRSVRTIRIEGNGDTPKRLPPAGHRAAGLVLADPLARLLLAGQEREAWPSPLRVVIVEGEPDFLTWGTRFSDADENAPAVVGVLSGAWTSEHAARIPDGAEVSIWTHNDCAGDHYADEVGRSLAARCSVSRRVEVRDGLE